MRRIKTAMVMCTALVLSMSCGGALPGGGGLGGLSADCSGDFGAGAAAAKLEAFLTATNDFTTTAGEINTALIQACKDMGSELGLPAADMEPQGDTPAVRAACAPVAAKIQAELADLRATAHLEIVIVATPPVCEVSIDAYGGCMAECDVEYQPGSVDVQCEGGELRGGCSAECTGQCSVEASGQCSGACEGTCSGSCTGTCSGACEGTCATRNAEGQCEGRCNGTCRGTCSAGCTGSCSGQCSVQASGSCSGECRGGCSVEFTAPRCTGVVRPPQASADCQASCDARLDAQAECRPGQATIDIRGDVASNVEERVGRLRQAIESGMPVVGVLARKMRRLAVSGAAMIRAGADVPDAVASLGVNATRCAGQAVAALPQATAQISVSIEVSASFSASAG